MKYTLETKIRFAVSLGRWTEEEFYTLEELGFSEENLNDYTESEIEDEIKEMYEDWENNYLDHGWSVVNDD